MEDKSKKTKRGKYNPNQIIATDKYTAANFDRINIKVRKGKKEKINELAASLNMTTTAYIISLIEEDAKKRGFDLSVPPTPSQINKIKMKEEN